MLLLWLTNPNLAERVGVCVCGVGGGCGVVGLCSSKVRNYANTLKGELMSRQKVFNINIKNIKPFFKKSFITKRRIILR